MAESLLKGIKQNSDVASLGTSASRGRTDTLGFRTIFTLPPGETFSHSFSLGADYKHVEQESTVFELDGVPVTVVTSRPITYYPLTASYSATWAPKGSVTELNLGATLGLRGVGDRSRFFEDKRFKADGNFVYLRGDLSRTQDLPKDFQLFGKVQGQVSNRPLIDSEQFIGGGLGTARGYLESEAAGDNAIFGTLELRTPSLLSWLPGKGHEWRVYLFGDAGRLTLRNPLPEQDHTFLLASYGIGTRMQLFENLNGSLDLAVPVVSQASTEAHDPFSLFACGPSFNCIPIHDSSSLCFVTHMVAAGGAGAGRLLVGYGVDTPQEDHNRHDRERDRDCGAHWHEHGALAAARWHLPV